MKFPRPVELVCVASVWFGASMLGQEPQPTAADPTVEELMVQVFDAQRKLGAAIDPANPNHTLTVAREITGQNVAALIYAVWGDPRYAVQANYGCDVLWEQWPWIAQNYPPCQN